MSRRVDEIEFVLLALMLVVDRYRVHLNGDAALALEAGLTIVPVINKIDLPYARTEEVMSEMEHSLGIFSDEVLKVSAKTGLGVDELFQAIIERIPHPGKKEKGDNETTGQGDKESAGEPEPLKALVYNSHFDSYKGVVVYVRVMDGEIKAGEKIKFMAEGQEYLVQELGQFRPKPTVVESLERGQVGYLTATIKTIRDVRIGDTVTDALNPTASALPGYKQPKPMVFSGLYPVNTSDFEELRESLGKSAFVTHWYSHKGTPHNTPILLPQQLPRSPRDATTN